VKFNFTKIKMFKGVRKEGRLFIWCFLISCVLWLFMSLNRVYNTTVKIPVNFNFRNSKTYKYPFPKNIKVNINCTGWFLIKKQLRIENDHLTIYPEIFNSRINKEDIASLLIDFDKIYQKAKIIQPQEINLEEDNRSLKVVPIKNRIKITTQKGYGLFDSLHFYPNVATIIGAQSTLAKIKYVETIDTFLKEMSIDTSIKVRINNNYGSSVKIDPFKTHAYLPISLLTQKEIVKNIDANVLIKNGIFIPSKIKIVYQIPILMNNEMDEDLFILGYEKKESMESGKIKLFLKKCPRYITKYRIEPEFVNLFEVKHHSNIVKK